MPAEVAGVRPAHEVPHVDGGVVGGAEQQPARLGEAGGGERGVGGGGLVLGNLLQLRTVRFSFGTHEGLVLDNLLQLRTVRFSFCMKGLFRVCHNEWQCSTVRPFRYVSLSLWRTVVHCHFLWRTLYWSISSK